MTIHISPIYIFWFNAYLHDAVMITYSYYSSIVHDLTKHFAEQQIKMLVNSSTKIQLYSKLSTLANLIG